jgi:hypothetical protein
MEKEEVLTTHQYWAKSALDGLPPGAGKYGDEGEGKK